MKKKSQVHFGNVSVSFSGDIKTLNRICKKFHGRDGVGIEIKSFLETVYFDGNPFHIGGDCGEASIELASVSDHALTEILKIMANDKETEDSPEVLLCQEILDELERAETIHPNWPTDPVHAGAILAEEAGEVVKAINNVVTKHKEDSDYRTEAVQCAAMCIRFLKNLDRYDWEIPY